MSSPKKPDFKIDLCSRAGKSTNNLYLAFQDPEKLADVRSKVQQYMGGVHHVQKPKEYVGLRNDP